MGKQAAGGEKCGIWDPLNDGFQWGNGPPEAKFCPNLGPNPRNTPNPRSEILLLTRGGSWEGGVLARISPDCRQLVNLFIPGAFAPLPCTVYLVTDNTKSYLDHFAQAEMVEYHNCLIYQSFSR